MSLGATGAQSNADRQDNGVSADALTVPERIKLVRAGLNNQLRTEATHPSRQLLAQWYNFGKFRPPEVPYEKAPNPPPSSKPAQPQSPPPAAEDLSPQTEVPPAPSQMWRNF